MLNAESVPAKKPALDQAASTEPWPVAWIACSAGTSAPGSFTRRSMRAGRRCGSSFFASFTGASPISVRLFGNALARLMRTFCWRVRAAGEGERAQRADQNLHGSPPL